MFEFLQMIMQVNVTVHQNCKKLLSKVT